MKLVLDSNIQYMMSSLKWMWKEAFVLLLLLSRCILRVMSGT